MTACLRRSFLRLLTVIAVTTMTTATVVTAAVRAMAKGALDPVTASMPSFSSGM